MGSWQIRGVLLAALATAPIATRQTVGGAYERARIRLELVTRDGAARRENRGAQGRINSLRENAHLSEEPPLVQPPLSGPWHY